MTASRCAGFRSSRRRSRPAGTSTLYRESSRAEGRPHEPGPAGEEAESPEWRDGAEPADACDGQEVETAREEHGAGDEQPAGGAAARPARGRRGHRDQAERVKELIADARLERGEHLGRQTAAQAVRGERTERDGDEGRERAQPEEEPVRRYSTVTDFARLRG